VLLNDGDRISLVLSVAPLAEQYFTYRCGNPRDAELPGSAERSWVDSTLSTAGGVFSPSTGNMPGTSPAPLSRTATSRYTTAEASTLDDLRCQICLNTLRQCVALEPCGHNYCATCLSHHLGSQLQAGVPLSCPFRCPPPQRVAINYAVRALIDLLGAGGMRTAGSGGEQSARARQGRDMQQQQQQQQASATDSPHAVRAAPQQQHPGSATSPVRSPARQHAVHGGSQQGAAWNAAALSHTK
jgi:Zinc finger, C3HC4 type (RING finger)